MNIFNTKFLAGFGIAFVFVVIGLGAWTRLADAGLGCPDWPGCYGLITFPTTAEEIAIAEELFPDSPVEIDKIIPEWVHRLFAGLAGLLAVFLVFIAFKEKRFVKTSLTLLVAISCQGIFGALTVTLLLHPLIVTAHLFGAMVVASLFLIIFLRSLNLKSNYHALIANKGFIFFGFALIIFQIFLGAWTSTNYAARACLDIPLCQGELFPVTDFSEGFNLFQPLGDNYLYGQMSDNARVAIHLTHRIGAIVVLLYSLFLAHKIWSTTTKKIVIVFLSLLGIQIFLGINNVLSSLPLWNAVAHNIVGVMLFMCFVVMIYLSKGYKYESK
tara:strand:- start:428 stop:1411 length:984 start_codon:yes stop_codon:yes gene_type:complete